MKNKKVWLVLFLLVGLSLTSCDQLDEANKLMDEANAKIEKRNELIPEYNRLFGDLFGENITKAENIEDYKKENKPKFDRVASLSERIGKTSDEIKEKFEQISTLQIDDEKNKEYFDLFLQEWEKTAELDEFELSFIKTFLETEDVDKINEQIEDFDKRKAGLNKEIEEIRKKIEKFEKENPDAFKKN